MRWIILLVGLLGGVQSCFGPSIQGRVVDVQGGSLPGVAVNVVNTGDQDLTTPLGEYRVRYEPGHVELEFLKTGYTRGRLEMTLEEARNVSARDVMLWPLPQAKGVYFFANFRYRATAALEPQAFETANLGTVYGTEHWTDVQTVDAAPVLIAHRLPLAGLRMHRMELRELFVEEPSGGTRSVEAWTRAGEVPIDGQYLDEDGALLQVILTDELDPGAYAVHWGALEGDPAVDTRIFFFSILPSLAPDLPGAMEEEAPEDGGEAPENGDGEGEET